MVSIRKNGGRISSYPLTAPLRRLRHLRGKGVHSPFMYGVVRNVFLPKKIMGQDCEFYDELRRKGVKKRNAVLLQNLYDYCGSNEYFFSGNEKLLSATMSGRSICIVNSHDAADTVLDMAEMLDGTDSVLVWIARDRCHSKREVVGKICRSRHCVTVNRRSMIIVFFDRKLNRQKYWL